VLQLSPIVVTNSTVERFFEKISISLLRPTGDSAVIIQTRARRIWHRAYTGYLILIFSYLGDRVVKLEYGQRRKNKNNRADDDMAEILM